MKKFFLALTVVLLVAVSNFAESAPFTREQIEETISITVKNPDAAEDKSLPFDAATFQRNYRNYIANFVREPNAGADAAEAINFLSLDDAAYLTRDDKNLFAKDFLGRVSIVGLSDNGGNLKVLNFFAAVLEGRDDALLNVLILQAFVQGIAPDFDAMTLLNQAKKNPSAPVIRDGIKFSISTFNNMNIITAVAE